MLPERRAIPLLIGRRQTCYCKRRRDINKEQTASDPFTLLANLALIWKTLRARNRITIAIVVKTRKKMASIIKVQAIPVQE